jgi:hydroxyacylglutathione hydrolase
MIEEIRKNIFKFSYSSNFYYYKDLNLLIDTGCRLDVKSINKEFIKIDDFINVKYVIFTHLHYDHIGNFNLFKNSKFFASKAAIIDFNISAIDCVLDLIITKEFSSKVNLIDIESINKNIKEKFKIIYSPGHTNGSICLLDKKNKLLFSGDTLFYNNVFGRYDLPTSKPKEYNKTLKNIFNIDYDLLCPGHDY